MAITPGLRDLLGVRARNSAKPSCYASERSCPWPMVSHSPCQQGDLERQVEGRPAGLWERPATAGEPYSPRAQQVGAEHPITLTNSLWLLAPPQPSGLSFSSEHQKHHTRRGVSPAPGHASSFAHTLVFTHLVIL